MAKSKQDKQLYRRLRGSGVRKKVARRLTAVRSHAKGGKQAPRPLRDAVARLEASVLELRDHSGTATERPPVARRPKHGARRRSGAAPRRAGPAEVDQRRNSRGDELS